VLSMPLSVLDEDIGALRAAWEREASAVRGEVSVQLRTLHGPVASRRARASHYAASTVKLAVLVAALAEGAMGRLDVRGEVEIRDAFTSAAGGPFTLRQADDQDDATWAHLGGSLPVGALLERMIVDSSNIATNTIVEAIGFDPVRHAAALGCGDGMTMNHLVGDERAKAYGPANAVTAWGRGRRQGSLAPRRLVPASWSASKGGWTAAVNHDVALVRPGHAPAYVLAVCTTTGLNEAAERLVARLSAVTWEHWTRWHVS
jgi:beta-lactamase class A